MDPLDLLDATINDAEDMLHRSSGADFRLREMIINEISYVDRAANKRRFLLVKRASGSGEAMAAKKNDTALDDQAKNTVLTLTSETKNAIAESLTGALGRMVEVANAIKDAVETDDVEKSVLPIDIGKQLRAAISTVGEVLSGHIFKKEDNQAIDALMKVAETSMMLAETVAEEETISAEVVARTKQMAELLSAVADRGNGDTTVDESEKRIVEQDAKIAELETQVKALLDATKSAPKDDTKDAGKDDTKVDDTVSKSDEKIDALTQTVAALAEQLKATLDKPADKADNKPADKGDELAKRLDELENDNKVLKSKLEKAIEDPPVRGGTQTPTKKSDSNNGRRLFPEVYGSTVHDPEPGA